jgi:hypothetical protein
MMAHDIAEAMAEVDASAKRSVLGINEAAWEAISHVIPSAVNVVKGTLPIPDELVQFGRDLFMAGQFKLPFPTVFFAPPNTAFDGILAWQADDMLFMHTCTNVRASYRDNARTVALPVFSVLIKSGVGSEPEVRTNFIIEPAADNESEKTWPLLLDIVLGTTVLMSTKYVVLRPEPAPDRLNKARERKGRAPVGTKIFVSFAKTLPNARGGTHASPVPHWRRGHLRTLADGRVVPVSPSIVAWVGGEKPVPRDYAFKAPTVAKK